MTAIDDPVGTTAPPAIGAVGNSSTRPDSAVTAESGRSQSAAAGRAARRWRPPVTADVAGTPITVPAALTVEAMATLVDFLATVYDPEHADDVAYLSDGLRSWLRTVSATGAVPPVTADVVALGEGVKRLADQLQGA